MLRELSLGRARYLITADEARLARKPTLRLALELELARYGIKLIYVSQAATMKKRTTYQLTGKEGYMSQTI